MNNTKNKPPEDSTFDPQIDLLPELASNIYEERYGQVLHHPYIIEKGYDPSMNAFLNQRYRAIDDVVKEGFVAGDFHYTFIEAPYRLQILLENERFITDESKWWKCIKEIYLKTDDISQYHQEYIDIFSGKYRKNTKMIMNEYEQNYFSNLPDQVQIYRGSNDKNDNSFSYTLDKEIAVWLSTRFPPKDAVLIEKIVNKDDLVCFFDTPGKEVIWLNTLPELVGI